MKNSNDLRTGSYPGFMNFEENIILGLFIPKRVDYIGFNDPLLILAKKQRKIKIPNIAHKSNLIILISNKSNPQNPTILLNYIFINDSMIFLFKYYFML